MKLFKTYRYTWQQIAVFKLALLSIGTLIGSNWQQLVSEYTALIFVVAVMATAYTLYVSFTQ